MRQIIEKIVKETWLPFVVTSIEILLIAGILWTLCFFVPHTIVFLQDQSFINWLVAVICVRLLTYKSKATDDIDQPQYDEDTEQPDRELMVPLMDVQTVADDIPRPREVINVKNGIYPFTQGNREEGMSTRE